MVCRCPFCYSVIKDVAKCSKLYGVPYSFRQATTGNYMVYDPNMYWTQSSLGIRVSEKEALRRTNRSLTPPSVHRRLNWPLDCPLEGFVHWNMYFLMYKYICIYLHMYLLIHKALSTFCGAMFLICTSTNNGKPCATFFFTTKRPNQETRFSCMAWSLVYVICASLLVFDNDWEPIKTEDGSPLELAPRSDWLI